MGHVVVVGAGISGVACAGVLVAAGHRVTVLDRGRRVGGRMAVRHHAGRPVDTGASYFTVSDPAFRSVVDDWQARGLAREWTTRFTALSPSGEEVKSGPIRWAAPLGLRELIADLARGLEVSSGVTVDRVDLSDGRPRVDGETADAVVLAMPDPQARRLLSPDFRAESARLTDDFEPVLALTVAWNERIWPDRDGVFVNEHAVLAWIADDGLRRGDRAPVLVAHSTPDFARTRLADPASAVEPMVAAVREVLDIGCPSTGDGTPNLAVVQRWTFARPVGRRDRQFHLSASGLGFCGDSWSDRPRVEAAFLSGRALGAALVESSA